MNSTLSQSTWLASIVILVAAASTRPARAEVIYPTAFPDGAQSLFAGHSFFVPVAASFNQLATQNGYSAHSMESVFAPGGQGSPGSLWENEVKYAAIVDVLDDGDVELFGLTTAFEIGSAVEDYSRWIDLALSYNPNTEFVIGVPWVIFGPTDVIGGAEGFAATNAERAAQEWEKVQALRAANPEATIHYIDYSLVGSIMYEMYENGELPDIRGLTPDLQNGVTPQEALFADPLLGHGGPMMVEVAALVWMELLYGADVDSLTYTDYETDVAAIVNQVVAYNGQFAVPEPGSFVLFGGALVGLLVLGRRRGYSHRMQTSLAVLIGAISLSFAGPASAQQDPYMVSAFFGLDDAFPTMGNVVFLPTSNPWNAQTGNPTRSNPTGADLTGLDGMPIVFSESLNPATVDPSDFLITTASGVTYTPLAATINPAFEPGERHTVLLAGQFGTAPSGSNPGDPPLTVSLVGSLLTFDGVPIAPQNVDPVNVTPLEDGPSLVYAKPVDVAPASPDFVPGSELVLMAIWDGGIEATDGNEVTDDEWTQYVLRGFDAIGNAVELTPFAIGDLNDNDNNHLLYFDEKIVPDTLFLPGGLVIDPRGDANTDTFVSVVRPSAVPEPGALALGAIAFFLAAWQVRRAG